jgi:hypothetical protein
LCRIIRTERIHDTSRGRYKEVARFDVEVNNDLRLFDLRLFESNQGNFIVKAAPTWRGRSATFSPSLAREITAAASLALNNIEGTSLEHSSAA